MNTVNISFGIGESTWPTISEYLLLDYKKNNIVRSALPLPNSECMYGGITSMRTPNS